MKRGLRAHLFRQLRLRDTWVILFILGFVMMNYPFISIFNKPLLVGEIPLLYLYLQWGWLVSILIAYLFARSVESGKDNEGHR